MVAHHLQLELLPADDAAFNEDLMGGRQIESATYQLLELVAIVGNAPTRATQCERGTNDRRVAGSLDNVHRLLDTLRDTSFGDAQPDTAHRRGKESAILRDRDGPRGRPDQLDTVAVERT